jgi:ectoine hydroxylase-related dioxygenase (phytanoyl-CoA dioxygenase family)
MAYPHTPISGSIDCIEHALANLGANAALLSDEERRSLDDQGYLVLPNHLHQEFLQDLRTTHERLMSDKYGHGQITSTDPGDYWHNESGTRRLADLVSEDPIYDRLYTDPKHLAAVYHVLRCEFKLHSLNARDALPGHGRQGLHRDGDPPGVEELINAAFLLDGFTVENGATRVVPGSHRWPQAPSGGVNDPLVDHPDQILVLAPPGSVVIFNTRLWHSGTDNRTDVPRRVIHLAMSAREVPQPSRQRDRIRKSTFERISPAARYLLDLA